MPADVSSLRSSSLDTMSRKGKWVGMVGKWWKRGTVLSSCRLKTVSSFAVVSKPPDAIFGWKVGCKDLVNCVRERVRDRFMKGFSKQSSLPREGEPPREQLLAFLCVYLVHEHPSTTATQQRPSFHVVMNHSRTTPSWKKGNSLSFPRETGGKDHGYPATNRRPLLALGVMVVR